MQRFRLEKFTALMVAKGKTLTCLVPIHHLFFLNIQLKTFTAFLVREGNGTPLQYSCLENPMDGGAWWAAVHGVAKSQT